MSDSCDIRALRKDRFGFILICFGVAPTIPFIIASARLEHVADACEYPLYATGSGALAMMWALLLLIWLIFTSARPVGAAGRLTLMLFMIGGLIFAAFNLASYEKEDRCKLQYLYPSGYQIYDSRLGRYNMSANRLAWGLPTEQQEFFSDSYAGVSSMLLVYSVFPVSVSIAWFFIAGVLLIPHFMCYGLYSKTCTSGHWSHRVKQFMVCEWLAVEPDELTAQQTAALRERFPPPLRRLNLAIPMLAMYLGVGIPGVIRLVALSEPTRYTNLRCDNPLWQGAIVQLIGLGFMLVFIWLSYTARRPSMFRASMAHILTMGMWIFSIINLSWYDMEGSCKNNYLSGCYYSTAPHCYHTADQDGLVAIHLGLTLCVFFWAISPITFWPIWGIIMGLVVAPSVAVWSILSRSADSCCTLMSTAAICWWRTDDEADWDDDIEPEVLAARKARAAAGIGSAPVNIVVVASPVISSPTVATPNTTDTPTPDERKDNQNNLEMKIVEIKKAAAKKAAAKKKEITPNNVIKARKKEMRKEFRNAAKKANEKNAALTPIVVPLLPSSSASMTPSVSSGIPAAPPLIIATPSLSRQSDAPPPAYAPPPGGAALEGMPASAPPPYVPPEITVSPRVVRPPSPSAIAIPGGVEPVVALQAPPVASIEEMVFCGSCGTQRFVLSDRFCRKCGTPIL